MGFSSRVVWYPEICTEVLAEENNLADFWGSFQDLIFKIEIANY